MIFADGDRNGLGRKTRPADESAAFDLADGWIGELRGNQLNSREGKSSRRDQAFLAFFQMKEIEILTTSIYFS
jgi:hypothetical protein